MNVKQIIQILDIVFSSTQTKDLKNRGNSLIDVYARISSLKFDLSVR